MKPLAPPDTHHLSAAWGWLGLGNWKEAVQEYQQLAEQTRQHPDVLEVAREIFIQAGKWEMAVETAGALVKLKPEEPGSWIALAYATRRKQGGGLGAAREILTLAQSRFPKDTIITYNLACYECQLGNQSAALDWLRKAFATGAASQIRSMALDDHDLEPLWPKIREP
ncbi:MAG: tetratricopeptide repeat protein [Verrucomicrobiota bacterium]|jgi:predicted Zn-dependent protease